MSTIIAKSKPKSKPKSPPSKSKPKSKMRGGGEEEENRQMIEFFDQPVTKFGYGFTNADKEWLKMQTLNNKQTTVRDVFQQITIPSLHHVLITYKVEGRHHSLTLSPKPGSITKPGSIHVGKTDENSLLKTTTRYIKIAHSMTENEIFSCIASTLLQDGQTFIYCRDTSRQFTNVIINYNHKDSTQMYERLKQQRP